MTPQTADPAAEDREPAAELAARYGLHRVGSRPSLLQYIRQLWQRRHFTAALAQSRSYSRNQNNYLGQLWSVLNPLLLAAVYYLVFGVLLDTGGGVENFPAFLVVGIFIFQFFSGTVAAGSGSITGNLTMVRALHFPRAALPISVAVSELLTLLPALVMMLGLVLVTGETPNWGWLLFPVAVAVVALFNAGCAFIAARIVVAARDLRNLIPLSTRLLRYVSGVFYSIGFYTGDGIAGFILYYQPVAVYLNLVRSTVLDEFDQDPVLWAVGVGWALLFVIIGFIVFWQAEDRYGRD